MDRSGWGHRLLVLLEKLLPRGELIERLVGGLLIGWGVVLLV
jgi:predicted metal-binding membrane protein